MKAMWIDTSGVLVCMPARLAAQWREELDYKDVSMVRSAIGCVRIHGIDCLVLNEEPLSTAWFSDPSSGYFVRWAAAESEEQVIATAKTLRNAVPQQKCIAVFETGKYLLFDAALGPRMSTPLVVYLEGGMYQICSHRTFALPDIEVITLSLQRRTKQ